MARTQGERETGDASQGDTNRASGGSPLIGGVAPAQDAGQVARPQVTVETSQPDANSTLAPSPSMVTKTNTPTPNIPQSISVVTQERIREGITEAVRHGPGIDIEAYSNFTQRTNLFDQTDLTGTSNTGPFVHGLLLDAEFGDQSAFNLRRTGLFNTATATSVLS